MVARRESDSADVEEGEEKEQRVSRSQKEQWTASETTAKRGHRQRVPKIPSAGGWDCGDESLLKCGREAAFKGGWNR